MTSRPNYSNEWKKVIDGGGLSSLSLKEIEGLYKILAKCNYLRPPDRPPTLVKRESSDDSVTNSSLSTMSITTKLKSTRTQDLSSNASVGSSSNSNFYSQLDDDDSDGDDDDEEESDIDDIDDINPTPVQNNNYNGPEIMLQTRYLLIKLVCGIVELYRKEAYEGLHQKKYVIVAQAFQRAYEKLNHTVSSTDKHYSIDEWYAIFLQYIEDTPTIVNTSIPLPDGHDHVQLEEIIDNISILFDDTKIEKEKAVHYIEVQLKKVTAILDPLLEDRDEVKSVYGEYRWTHNPAPKLTYAEKRRQWEDEKKQAEEALAVIKPLSFTGVIPTTKKSKAHRSIENNGHPNRSYNKSNTQHNTTFPPRHHHQQQQRSYRPQSHSIPENSTDINTTIPRTITGTGSYKKSTSRPHRHHHGGGGGGGGRGPGGHGSQSTGGRGGGPRPQRSQAALDRAERGRNYLFKDD